MDVPDYAIKAHSGEKKDHLYKPVPVQDLEESSSTRTKFPVGGICTLIGGFLVCLSFGSDFSYPNINTYLTSYMRENGHNDGLAYLDFVFLTTTKMVIQGAAMPWLGGLARKMGPRMAVALGSAIYSGGYLLTYFTVKHHFVLAILSLSLHGVAFCFVYATTIRTAQAWFSPRRKGLVASIVVSGYGFGSSLWAPIQTIFVNPDNLKAGVASNCSDEVMMANMTFSSNPVLTNSNISDKVAESGNCTVTGPQYFTDPAVLARVPLMFLLLGTIYAIMGFVAVILISEPDETNIEKCDKENKEVEENRLELKKDKPKNLSPLEVLKTCWFYQV